MIANASPLNRHGKRTYWIVLPGLPCFSAALISKSRSSYVTEKRSVRPFLEKILTVRIHLPPPASLKRRETLRLASENRLKCPQFRMLLAETGLGESALIDLRGHACGSFLSWADRQSGLKFHIKRMECD